MKKNLVVLSIVLIFTSCANKSSQSTTSNDNLSDSLAVGDEAGEFVEEENVNTVDLTRKSEEEAVAETETPEPVTEEKIAVETTPPVDRSQETEIATDNTAVENSSVAITDKIEEFAVESGDSLMWVAFKIYGDYSKWKMLKDLNPKITKKRLSKGEKVKYYLPVEKFVWSPKGLPHIIKTKDTLGSISKEKYGTEKNWKSIFDNNKPMIKNPNLIFAGFTLYYLKDARNIASE